MEVRQARWRLGRWDEPLTLPGARLVLLFGAPHLVSDSTILAEIRSAWPQALVAGCSTGGEILGTEVSDDTVVVTAVQFDAATVHGTFVRLSDYEGSDAAGAAATAALPSSGMRHALVLSDGLEVNASQLVDGLKVGLSRSVRVTGGLAADGDRFERSLVAWGAPGEELVASQGGVVLLGLYGESLRVGHGSLGGWDPFGPERLVTKSEGNRLLELDGRPALDLYRRYLGEHAASLPASALHFPLSLRPPDGGDPVVRTILGIDDGPPASMTFAGDLPEGHYAQFMKANFDRLVDGAVGAANRAQESLGESPELAILISCVGRKLVLQQRIEEEVEGVREVLGPSAAFAGFYSYGEISPLTPDSRCELHNQTMTITTLRER